MKDWLDKLLEDERAYKLENAFHLIIMGLGVIVIVLSIICLIVYSV